MAKSKAYRDAVTASGESDKFTRKRVIIASGLTTTCERNLALSDTGLKTSHCPPLKPANKSNEATNTKYPEDSRLSSYRNWIEQRKTLREDLDNCGKTHNWLESKPYLSEVEQRVKNAQFASEKKLKDSQKHQASNADTEYDLHGSSDSRNRPSIKQPLPVILATISDYLAKKRLRMYDLFVLADKDKDWTITKKEFYEVMKVAGIPIKYDEIEQLIAALDQNHNDSLEYKELVQGRDLFVLSERAKKQSHTELQPLSAQDSARDFENLQDTEPSLAIRSSSPSLLSLPDTSSSESLLMKTVDKEKHLRRQKRKEKRRHKTTREAKKVRALCTMGGVTGLMVDKFQKDKQKEYEEILELCHLYGVQLSKGMLERVLLHPEDRPKDVCISSLKPPSTYLLSEQELYRRLAPAALEKHGKRRYSKDHRRKSSVYTHYVYPPTACVTPKVERMNLSSGAANVSRKTDCWMTYEEYSKLTRHLDSRFEKSWKPTDDDAYWPSYVLDKVRLYLDQPRTQVRSENSIFEVIHNKTIH